MGKKKSQAGEKHKGKRTCGTRHVDTKKEGETRRQISICQSTRETAAPHPEDHRKTRAPGRKGGTTISGDNVYASKGDTKGKGIRIHAAPAERSARLTSKGLLRTQI